MKKTLFSTLFSTFFLPLDAFDKYIAFITHEGVGFTFDAVLSISILEHWTGISSDSNRIGQKARTNEYRHNAELLKLSGFQQYLRFFAIIIIMKIIST